MATIQLLLPSAAELVPTETIFMFENRDESNITTENDIVGNPIVVTKELNNTTQGWTLGAGYVPISVVDDCVAAYVNQTNLTLVSEQGVQYTVIIVEHPINAVERHKTVEGDVVYVVKLTLQINNEVWTIPVLSTTGPRLFGR